MSDTGVSRRSFLKGTAATAATVLILPKHVYGANERPNLACIGVGGKGGGDTSDGRNCGANVVAMCDTNSTRMDEKTKEFPNAKKYRDFRKMLDEMDKEIDAVTVSTPDHTHFPASMCAAMRGKHVFCQKPLTHNIWEARRIAQVVREKNLASQMGIQGHANEGARLLCEWVWSGILGDITEVHYYTNRPVWAQGQGRPSKVDPVPGDLDWNLWLSVAPERPYSRAYCPFAWRGWWDYGAGAIGDIACHTTDAGFWALDLRCPTSVEAKSSPVNNESFPSWSIITFQFPARGNLAPVKVIWNDGDKGRNFPKPEQLEKDRKLPDECGAIFYGTKATVLQPFYADWVRIIPETKQKELEPGKNVPKTIPRSPGHMREFIQAIKGGKPAAANFEYAAAATEFAHLGNLAIRAQTKVTWDQKAMKTDVAEVNKYVRREPRKGYEEFYKGPDVPPPPQPAVGAPPDAKINQKTGEKAEAKAQTKAETKGAAR